MMKRLPVLLFLAILMFFYKANAQYKDFELVWSDEFNYTGLPDSSKWNYDVGGHGWGNNEMEYYTCKRLANTRVENGNLIIEARKEDYLGKQFTSGRLITNGKGDWLYGRIEIRAKLPYGRGTWPAAWLLSSNWTYGAWPESGEVDIMEHVGYDMGVNHVSCHTYDYQWKKGTQKTAVIRLDSIDSKFYTYAIEWRPDRIDAYIDDSLYFTCRKETGGWTKWPFDKPFYLILNLAVGGAWAGLQGIDYTAFPQQLVVDYVRVYKYITPKDTIPPVSPVNLIANESSNRVTLLWEPGYDNFGIQKYKVLCNGKEIGTSVRHDFEADNLSPAKTYNFQVIAVDWSGNESKPLTGQYTTRKTIAAVIPGKIEAEDYTKQSGVFNEKTTDENGGMDVCWIEPGDRMNYYVKVSNTGHYHINFRTATERVDGKVELYDEQGRLLFSTPISNTKSWQGWQTFISPSFNLVKGNQTLTLKVTGDRINLNWFEVIADKSTEQ